MRLRSVRSLLLALALVLCSAVAAVAQTGTVTGTVRDGRAGQPVAGARVEVQAADGRVLGSATTDAAGSYRISGVPAGDQSLVISGSGFETRRVSVRVQDGRTANVVTTISGGAVDLDPLVVSASRAPQKATEAPARVEVVAAREIEARPVVTPVDHLRTVPGVDVAQTGLQSSNVVARGFNNIFSGALHALTDNRMAGVPSLRVNFLQFVPSTSEDISRMEVVLGPGAALYGPNTANGILHIITKSPLDEQGTLLTVAGSPNQSVFQTTFRHAALASENFGVKVSGQYLLGEEWRYYDPVEASERAKFASNLPFFRQDLMRAAGISQQQADERIARIAQRDFRLERYGLEGRADWRFRSNGTLILQSGLTRQVNGIELTGLGASQVRDWEYVYYQARANVGRLFAQSYVNVSNAGGTFLLRNGAPIIDKSRVWASQLQHGFEAFGGRQRFTYGGDYIYTIPRTEGTINGGYEDNDETREYGAYLQSETQLTPWLDLVLAGRIDHHSALEDEVFSPRAAIVVRPAEGHSFRASYNRAFSTPSSLNQFLDLGSAIPNTTLAQLGYSIRVQGTGDSGFSFLQPDGTYRMRSPFTPAASGGPGTLVPAQAAAYYRAAVQALAQSAAARGQPLNPQLLQYLLTLQPTSAQVGNSFLNPVDGTISGTLTLDEIAPIREDISTTFEVGYQGILGGRLLVAADVWRTERESFVTPLTIQTPLVLLNGQQLGAFLVPRFIQDLGMTQAQAQATAAQLIGSATSPGLGSIPVGVISSADVNTNGAQLLTTYVNVDETLEYWGADLAATALLNDLWTLSLNGSYVNRDRFEGTSAGLVTLNAPRKKGSVSLRYNNEDGNGLLGEVRVRYTDGYPVNSGVYIGTECLGVTATGVEPCVDAYTLVDVNFGYRLPRWQRASVQLSITNLMDEDYRPFPGTPNIGRMALVRVKYEF